MKFSLFGSAKSLLRLSECVIGKWARRGEVSWGVVKETTPPRPRGLRPIPSCHQKSRKRIWGRVVFSAPTIPPLCGNMNETKFSLFVMCRLAGLRKMLNVLFDFDLNNPQTMIQSWRGQAEVHLQVARLSKNVFQHGSQLLDEGGLPSRFRSFLVAHSTSVLLISLRRSLNVSKTMTTVTILTIMTTVTLRK